MKESDQGVYQHHEKMDDTEKSREIFDNSSSKVSPTELIATSLDGTKVEMLQQRMQEVRKSVIDNFNDKLNDVMLDVVRDLYANTTELNGYQKKASVDSTQRRKGRIIDKQFIPRNSLLTDLFEVNHFRTIYNIFMVAAFVLFLTSSVHDYIEIGKINFGIKTIVLGFGNFDLAVQIWLLMTFSCCMTYIGVYTWAQQRIETTPKSFLMKILDYGFSLLFAIDLIAFIIIPAKVVIHNPFGEASSLMILLEQCRMLMKKYAFVRSNAPRILAKKVNDEENRGSGCPEFSKFLYFLFAPTIVYRDGYPRTKCIRWGVVLRYLLEITLIIFYVAFVFERFITPTYAKQSLKIFEPKTAILTVFDSMVPAVVLFLCGFYTVLHVVQNVMAELLTFADRLFYKDWWNCTSYDAYYRTWNIPVHDWLYTYIYKDVVEKLHSKVLATLVVFIISAVFHEYILAISFGFFYPVMLILFGGFGMLLVFLTRKFTKVSGNLFLWYSLFTGNGILFSLYAMEIFARAKCPPHEDQLLDILMPRSWYCHKIFSDSSFS